MIRGRKNFLPASSLEMGLGVLFRLGDDASISRHANDRRDFALLEQEEIMVKEDEMKQKQEETLPHPQGSKKDELNEDGDDNSEPPQDNEVADGPNNEIDEELSEKMEAANMVDEDDNGAPDPKNDKSVSFQKTAPPPTKTVKKKEKELSRGKRAKNRRAKKKYADQDEEDRELAMMALQGGESSKKGKKKGSKIVAEEDSTESRTGRKATPCP